MAYSGSSAGKSGRDRRGRSCIGSSTRKMVRLGSLSHFDDAAVVVDDLGDEREAEPGAVTLGRDERIEQVLLQVIGNAGSVVLDLNHQRQADARLGALHREAHAGPERRLR